jgi:pimeloyl-ACP methyl ester carboxylesterase
MSRKRRMSSGEMASGGANAYNEFGLLHENATEQGVPVHNLPWGSRVEVDGAEQRISAIRWGTDDPALVLLHGGGQNAHTWDSLIVRLGPRWPALAVDLTGHGHSSGWVSADAVRMALDIDPMLDRYIREPVTLCGMSLGGIVAVVVAAMRPDLVSRLILVDMLPGVGGKHAHHILAGLNGPSSFDSFDDLWSRMTEVIPDRSVSELRRGILHNAAQQPDGTWRWRYRRAPTHGEWSIPDTSSFWPYLEGCTVPVMLVRGTRSTSVLEERDEGELLSRVPTAQIVHCDAGHNIQSDAPRCLASHIGTFAGQPGTKP